jgi:hypothetical protein
MATKPLANVNAAPTTLVANAAPATPAAPTAAQVTMAQHLAAATSLAILLGLGHVRVPTSYRWLVATAMLLHKGNVPQAQAQVATWCAAYGCPVPPASQYAVMQSWLSRGPHMDLTGISKPGRKVQAAAPVVASAAAAS